MTPQRLAQALRAWADDDAGRRAYADEVAAPLRRLPPPARAPRAPRRAAARRRRPRRAARATPPPGAATPVFFYGFDDLTTLQRDAVETLAATGAPVMLSLAFEPGRMAFAGRATTLHDLLHDDVEHVALAARAEHYAPASRAALHHLERELFELPGAGRLFEPDPVDAGDAVTLLQGGGERAELELVAAEIARLIADEGFAADEIAVVLRDPAPVAPLLVEVFGALGVPVAIDRRDRFGHTALGRGLVALLRCALLDGSAEDLLAWLRTPGLLRRPELADALEATARREGARTAAAARVLWEREHWPLDALDRVRDAHRRGAGELLARLDEDLATLFAAPRRRAAEVLTGPAAQDAEAFVAGRRAFAELRAIAEADRSLAPAPVELAALLEGLEVRGGARPVARLRDGLRAARAACAPRARAVRLRPAGGRLPADAGQRAVLRRQRARADRRRLGPAPAPPRRPRRRALPLLRDGVASRGAAVPVLARGLRRRRSERRVVLSVGRLRSLRAGAVGAAADAHARRGRLAARRAADRARAAAQRRGSGPAPPRGADRGARPTMRSSASCASARRGRHRRSSCGPDAR